MSGIKIFVIFAVRTLNFTVMSWSVGFYEFMPYATLFEASLEQCGRWILGIAKPFCKFGSVIRLDTLYLERKFFNQMLKKESGAVCAMFFKCL